MFSEFGRSVVSRIVKITPDSDSFVGFPYPSDGKENNGGFNLLKNPEKIDDITEFKKFPELRRFIEWLNFESMRYRSFGCDAGYIDTGFAGYIEFSFRSSEQAERWDLYDQLFDNFEDWTKAKFPGYEFGICSSLNPRWAKVLCDGKYFGIKICLCFEAQTQDTAAQLLDIFFEFLKEKEVQNQPVV